MKPSIAHKHDMNHFGLMAFPDKLVPWSEPRPPQVDKGDDTGRLRACGYCGSMHPADVAAAIRAGASGHWADRKYGWPHKAYFDGVPNPHAGMLEVRCSAHNWSERCPREVREPRYDEKTGERVADKVTYTEEPQPASEKTSGKFYTVHLMDATPEDRDIIEKHLGLSFTFSDDGKSVSWEKYNPS